MRTWTSAWGVLAMALIASSAKAEGPAISVGLRSGYAIPMGNLEKGSKLSDAHSGTVPIWVDAGYRPCPSFYVGAFFQYGISIVNVDKIPECSATGARCSGNDVRFGVDAHYRFMPEGSLVPWVGIGVGYEFLNTKTAGEQGDGSLGARGWEFVSLQTGADYKLRPGFGLGPWGGLTLGRFEHKSIEPDPQRVSGDIEDKGMHEWLMFGIRGVYDLLI